MKVQFDPSKLLPFSLSNIDCEKTLLLMRSVISSYDDGENVKIMVGKNKIDYLEGEEDVIDKIRDLIVFVDKKKAYLELYERMNKFLKKYNPCKIENGSCLCGQCCCGGCPHLTENGCSTKSLQCKLYLCNQIYLPSKVKKEYQKIYRMKNLFRCKMRSPIEIDLLL